MKTGVFLNYIGLGSNLLHLSYCHQIAKIHGPVTLITICKGLRDALSDDPLIKEVFLFDKNQKTILSIFKLSSFLKKKNLDKLFIYYPSQRIFWAAKLSGIKEVRYYSNVPKKDLHLVKTAKSFTESILNFKDCPTETSFFVTSDQKKNGEKIVNKNKFNIILGVGSSGKTTRWGVKNYINLINYLNSKGDYYFYLLCGRNEKNISEEIYSGVSKKNCLQLYDMSIKNLIPIFAAVDMYVGNDSFGHHITSQMKIPSIVIILDTPKAYTDYSVNQYRILPDGILIDEIGHDSAFNPNSVSVEKVIKKIFELKN